MKQEWTLHVENIGRVQEANVRISPLLLFVGDNNSGKSYLMTLLWGLLYLGKNLFTKESANTLRSYEKCEAWFIRHFRVEDKTVKLDTEATALYVAWFNELLQKYKDDFLKDLFNYGMNADVIRIDDYTYIMNNSAISFPIDNMLSHILSGRIDKVSCIDFIRTARENLDEYAKRIIFLLNASICWELIMGGIAGDFLTPPLDSNRHGEPIYLPTSRTGFMLAYKQILSDSLKTSFGPANAKARGKLTMPYVDFLQVITQFEQRPMNPENTKLVRFLEIHMLDGSFHIQKAELPEVDYEPAHYEGKDPLPLYLTSSVVTEAASLSLLLQSDIRFNALVIEEPEAHLHPALQRQMARFIIRLVNAGKIVWVTTHSDTFLQQVNNMIKLGVHPNKAALMEKYAYEDADLLDSFKVRMYQFSRTYANNKTEVTKLSGGKQGFEVPTFNNELDRILDETYCFQGDDE